MASQDEGTYAPKDAVGLAVESSLIMGAAGLTISAIQTSLTKQNVSGWAVFTRGGGIIAVFGVFLLGYRFYYHIALTKNIAASGAAFGFGRVAAANLREKDDSWNPTIGGFLSGAVLGLQR